jgi:hypothetical protein
MADDLTGLAIFGPTLGSLLLAASVVVRRRFAHLHREWRVLAFALVATG